MQFTIIAAVTDNWGIGNAGKLPWHPKRLSKDMAFFQEITSKGTFSVENDGFIFKCIPTEKTNVVIMGRLTWLSIPKKFRPLSNRINIVISEKLYDQESVGPRFFKTFSDAIDWCNVNETLVEHVYIIGGYGIYKTAFETLISKSVLLTKVDLYLKCDTFFPFNFLEEYKYININEQIEPLVNHQTKDCEEISCNFFLYYQ